MGKFKHGHSLKSGFTPEYRAYFAMKNRCLNPNQARFKDYGERGITICKRWLDGDGKRSGFECFLADVGPKPSQTHSLDRRFNDSGDEPWNVRWATHGEQARNTRATRVVDIGGGPMSFAEAVERYGTVSNTTAAMRIRRGWSYDDAILTPRGEVPANPEVPF